MNAREILEMSLQIEILAEKIYSDLGELFPEARPLFERLSREESRHADIVTINMKFLDVDVLPPEFAIDMTPLIKQTLETAVLLEKSIEKKEIALEEALQLSLAMEEAGVEAYFQNVMRGKSAHNGLNYAKQFYKDCKHHAELIQEFKETLELNRAMGKPVMSVRRLKLNCWEFKKCGREGEGFHADDLGICPASKEERLDGVHGGISAGRACWVVAGTLCGGEIQGTFAQKIRNCKECTFYRKVCEEERPIFHSSAMLLSKLEKG
jgi:rubrerythrin